jgi:hypothetical protein
MGQGERREKPKRRKKKKPPNLEGITAARTGVS